MLTFAANLYFRWDVRALRYILRIFACVCLFSKYVAPLLTRRSTLCTDVARRGGSGTLQKKLFRVHKVLDSLIGMNCVCSRVRFAAAPCSRQN